MYVFDASPLIVLGTADRLSILSSIDRRMVVPERVRAEVVDAGIDGGHADARRIRTAIEDGVLSVGTVDETPLYRDLCEVDGLSDADAAVIAYAEDRGCTAVLDEAYGRSIADAEGVDTLGTGALVVSRVVEGALAPAEGKDVVDELVDAGWYCSTALYRDITAKLEEL